MAGMDVGKREIFAVLRWADGTFERPWKVANPAEVRLLVERLQTMAQQRSLSVAMESTGTYGDPLHRALTEGGLAVHCVGGKAAHDYAEVFDGVPSQHDGKDAAVIAELAAFGKSRPWPFPEQSDRDASMAYWAEWLDSQQRIQMLWVGRLESLLSRHWPEVTRLLGLTSSVTLLKLLAHYGGPAHLAADPSALTRLERWSRSRSKKELFEKVMASASQTVGVPQKEVDLCRVKQGAALALAALREVAKARRKLEQLARDDELLRRQAAVVGMATACVLWVALGDPRNYPCGAAYRKAMGLNLKERSSGRHQGQLKITKRGPSSVRRWLYFAAMRMVQQPKVRRWHEAKKARDKDRGTGSLVAVMRKLALALHAVAVRDEPFEAWRLFPGRSMAGKRSQWIVETASDKPRRRQKTVGH